VKRTLRHPIRGDRLHPKPSTRSAKHGTWRGNTAGPRMRPRKSVNVASIVGSPEEEEARPNLRLRIVGVVVLLLFGVLVLRLWSCRWSKEELRGGGDTQPGACRERRRPTWGDRRPGRDGARLEHAAAGNPLSRAEATSNPPSSAWWRLWWVRHPSRCRTPSTTISTARMNPSRLRRRDAGHGAVLADTPI